MSSGSLLDAMRPCGCFVVAGAGLEARLVRPRHHRDRPGCRAVLGHRAQLVGISAHPLRKTPAQPCSIDQQRTESLHLAKDRDVINLDATCQARWVS